MAVKGKGVKLYSSARGGTPTWVQIASVESAKPHDQEADDIETTNMESADNYKEFMPGWIDAGAMDFTIQYAKAAVATIFALLGAENQFKLEFSDGSTWVADGYVKKFGQESERAGIIKQLVTIKLTGKPVWTAAA